MHHGAQSKPYNMFKFTFAMEQAAETIHEAGCFEILIFFGLIRTTHRSGSATQCFVQSDQIGCLR